MGSGCGFLVHFLKCFDGDDEFVCGRENKEVEDFNVVVRSKRILGELLLFESSNA